MGAARFKEGGSTAAWGTAPDDQIAELLVTLEFNLTKQYPAIEELSKNAGVLGQVPNPGAPSSVAKKSRSRQ